MSEQLETGWHEFHTKNALTSIAYVQENGDVFLPDAEFTADDFTTSTSVHPLVRKPRTVTTVEELDALPNGSVILDPSGISLHKNEFTGWGASNGAKGIDVEMIAEEGIPATVLHEGQA